MKKATSQALRATKALNAQPVKPKKQLGQYWLKQKSVLNKIIDSADLKKEDLVIEIGPGLGILTKELAEKAGKVIAIEKDSSLIHILRENLQELKNIEIIFGDALKTDFNHFKDYKIVANLPYYAATAIIRKLLESETKPKLMILMLQKEVAQRICPKSSKMSLLAISIQLYADAKIIDYVSKNAFSPKPKVDSAIIKIKPLTNNRESVNIDLFFKIVKAGFSQPRKQLLNNLSKNLKLPKEEIKIWLNNNDIDSIKRGQDLNLNDWLALTKKFPKP